MNFNPILDHPIRVFYSINVYQQSRLTHLFDLAPGDYSSSTFIKWLSTSDSVSVLSLVNSPAPLSSSQADTIPIVDDFLLKTLINLYSHTLSEVIDNPAATEAFTSLPDTRTSSKPTVILNSTNSIIQVNS